MIEDIEEIFSQLLRNLPLNDYDRRTFKLRKYIGGGKYGYIPRRREARFI